MQVSFFCFNAFPLFDPTERRPIGGMETRSWLFARGLARRPDYQVSFVVGQWDENAPRGFCFAGQYDGVQVYKYLPEDYAFWGDFLEKWSRDAMPSKWACDRPPWMRFSALKLSMLWQLPLRCVWGGLRVLAKLWRRAKRRWIPELLTGMNTLEGDVMCTFGVNYFSAGVVRSARSLGRRSVLFLASDADLDVRFYRWSLRFRADGILGHSGYALLRDADFVVVQNARQQQILQERFRRDADFIKNPIAIDDWHVETAQHNDERDVVLWVGRTDTFHKRPMLLLELARRCPDVLFLMILNKANDALFDKILAAKPPNVEVLQQVPHPEMKEYFSRARALVSTSSADFEGFPNTFLQAGLCGAAIVSLEVDPDGILAGDSCGIVCGGDMDALVEATQRVWSSDELRRQLSERFFEYIKSNHGFDQRVDELDRALRRIVAGPK